MFITGIPATAIPICSSRSAPAATPVFTAWLPSTSGSPNCSPLLWAEQHPDTPRAAAVCLRGRSCERSRARAGGAAPQSDVGRGKGAGDRLGFLAAFETRLRPGARGFCAGGQRQAGQGTAFGKALVQRYRAFLEEKGLAPSSINVRLAALRKLAMEAADNGLLDPAVASAIGRVKGAVQKGRRIGRWLTREEASLLLRDSGEEGLKAKRDRALLCLLLGAGLRREEIVSLEVEHIQQRDGRWLIADLIGKRKRIRTVPIPGGPKSRSITGPPPRESPRKTVPGGRQSRPPDGRDALHAGRLPRRHRTGKENRARARAP